MNLATSPVARGTSLECVCRRGSFLHAAIPFLVRTSSETPNRGKLAFVRLVLIFLSLAASHCLKQAVPPRSVTISRVSLRSVCFSFVTVARSIPCLLSVIRLPCERSLHKFFRNGCNPRFAGVGGPATSPLVIAGSADCPDLSHPCERLDHRLGFLAHPI